MAEEKLADFDKAPAHTIVADKGCRYHLAPVLVKNTPASLSLALSGSSR